jgi:hypothetical protein
MLGKNDPMAELITALTTGKTPAKPSGSPQAPAPAKAMGGYKIGTSYGGMKYLGGDPNVEKNWRK